MADKTFECPQCGADLKFDPEVSSIECPCCDHLIEIDVEAGRAAKVWEEHNFFAAIEQAADSRDTVEIQAVKCPGCAAEVSLDERLEADDCPYCGVSLGRDDRTTVRQIRPQGLLPFKVPHANALRSFRQWLKSRWFVPAELKRFARLDNKLQGVYIPYWTYDTSTVTHYTGQRGVYYWDTEHDTDSEGNRGSRRVRKTHWYSVSGTVCNSFDDILVLASDSLPRKYMRRLEPWDLHELRPCQEACLSGFRAENYSVSLEDGFERAREIIDPEIVQSIKHDIGGDEQRVWSKDITCNAITFKHLLLPIWVSAFRFRDKVYHFLVNGRTGEVQGERPWSLWKTALASLAAAALIAAIVLWAKNQ